MTFRVVTVGHMPGGEQFQNVFHFAGSSTVDADVDAVLDRLVDFYSALMNQMATGWGLDEFRTGEADGPVLRVDAADGVTGAGSGSPLPNDCAVLIRWRTIHPGRSGRGKTFLGGSVAGNLERNGSSGQSIVGASWASTISAAATALALDESVPMQVYSRKDGTGYSITGGDVSRQWATQRRRDQESQFPGVVFPG